MLLSRVGLATSLRMSSRFAVRATAARATAAPVALHNGYRFKSTISQEIGAISTPPAGEVSDAVANATSSVSDTIASATTYLPNQIGYFQQVGLAESWVWPKGFFQHVFEIAHAYSGLSWWATILVVTIGLRFLMLPLYISASDSTAKMARIKPELTKIMEKTKNATEQIDIQKAMLERKQLMKKADVKVTNMMKPIASVPIFLGVFGALTGMCKVPVPGLETEGLFWFTNLVAADPYCGLQIITACLYSLTFMLFGGETGAQGLSPVMKKVFTWMPFIAVPLTMSLPASVCFYFAINAVFSIIQSNMLKMPAVRNALNLAPMLTPAEQKKIDAEVARTQSSSIVGALRQKYDDAKLQAEKRVAQETKAKQDAMNRAAADAKRYVQYRK
ncbi:Mitochondrial inner membrane protein OXA1 [Wickerhamiella sorbophila]|uniref:Mitochondrial inner membrane protein OXA1 n=1 Tax=Wickerhamiella sorbophila TaxID=45607 RepID=A0A2T0FPG3_9ASCO|nr:Mitochondrial inner membrane protein OXA1 [Wickerhamiella sorbophila]PRT56867.1 Mitochondrial inner membrane protein OXA1 [Wickerhamiella sorbophila]